MASRAREISISDATALVEATGTAPRNDWSADQRIDFMLQTLQKLLQRKTLCAIALLDTSGLPDQKQRAVRRYHRGLPDQAKAARYLASDEYSQAVWEVCKSQIVQSVEQPGVVVTCVPGWALGEKQWHKTKLFQEFVEPMGFDDVIFCDWATGHDRAIASGVYHPVGTKPFTKEDVQLASLLHRAMAPMIDRDMFAEHPILAQQQLTERQQEVLGLMMTGRSEGEIARELSRSVHTVHTYVKQLYDHFDVSSRGELMAKFIDRRALPRDRSK